MVFLKVKVETGKFNEGGKLVYKNKVNPQSFKELSILLVDLENLDFPIEKAIKEFRLKRSDWDAVLGM